MTPGRGRRPACFCLPRLWPSSVARCSSSGVTVPARVGGTQPSVPRWTHRSGTGAHGRGRCHRRAPSSLGLRPACRGPPYRRGAVVRSCARMRARADRRVSHMHALSIIHCRPTRPRPRPRTPMPMSSPGPAPEPGSVQRPAQRCGTRRTVALASRRGARRLLGSRRTCTCTFAGGTRARRAGQSCARERQVQTGGDGGGPTRPSQTELFSVQPVSREP